MAVMVPAGLPSMEGLENIRYRETKFPEYITSPEKYENKEKPLQIILYNIMPDAMAAEHHFTEILTTTGYDIELTFVKPDSYTQKRVPEGHFENFYCTLEEIKQMEYDGIIYTGAPLAFIPFEEVMYKDDWIAMADWGEANINANLFVCWSGFAYYFYRWGVFWDEYEKMGLYQGKIQGVYPHNILGEDPLLEGMNNPFPAPHSRERGTNWKDARPLEEKGIIKVLAECETGPVVTKILGTKTFLNLCHLEYEQYRLDSEVQRDGGINGIPANYYPDDDITKEPYFTWREDGIKFYTNWIKYYVSTK